MGQWNIGVNGPNDPDDRNFDALSGCCRRLLSRNFEPKLKFDGRTTTRISAN
jgi:hypothetical protein